MQSLHSKKISFKVTIFIVVVFIFFTFNIFNIRNFLKGKLHNTLTPILAMSFHDGSKIDTTLNAILNLSAMQENNEKNSEKIIELEIENAKLRHIEKENNELREILNLPTQKEEVKKQVADVMMKDFKEGRWILINKGSDDGINKDDIAISPQNALVGSIYKVMKKSSYVQLTTSEESVYHVVLSGTDDNAVAKGSHGNSIRVDYIDSLAKIKEGDVFLYNDTKNAKIFAKKPSVGIVQEIFVPDDKLSQSVQLVPLYDIKSLNHVLIFDNNI